MKIEYIFHSGFTVETDNYFLVFDYYKGQINLREDKKTIVFSSHGHQDHFNPEILEWKKENPNIQYVLSSDIGIKAEPNIFIMKPYENLKVYDVNVHSFGSTDRGLSFLVEVEGKNIFFAGDLNWWLWPEDTEEEKEMMERDFKKEIEQIKGNNVDIAFFPVDPRLRENYSLGGKYFIEQIKPKYFMPIHFWNKFSTTKDFARDVKEPSTKILEIHRENQTIEIQ